MICVHVLQDPLLYAQINMKSSYTPVKLGKNKQKCISRLYLACSAGCVITGLVVYQWRYLWLYQWLGRKVLLCPLSIWTATSYTKALEIWVS